MKLGAKKILAFTLTPQLTPRLRSLFSGFTFVSFFIAQVYRAAGLLPENHPYLQPANKGRFGVIHVVAEAGLLMKRKGASFDQRAIYWLLMTGIVILAAQVALLALGLFVQSAHAVPFGPATNFFITLAPDQDLAFILLDRVFGIPDFFNSCVATGGVCLGSPLAAGQFWANSARTEIGVIAFPYPYHLAVHSALEMYSIALLIIAVLILCYFVFAVLAETAETGTPFGRRFNKIWAPIRLVAALGLLIPVANGLNAAQYIALYAAKFGSGFATNGWNVFTDEAIDGATTMLGDPDTLVAITRPPPVNTLMTFFALVSTCKLGYERVSEARGDPTRIEIHPYLINPRQAAEPRRNLDDAGWVFADALTYYNRGNITVRFGEYRVDAAGKPVYTNAVGNVEPICGEVTLPMSNIDETDTPGAYHALEQYFALLNQLWLEATIPPSPIYETGDAFTRRDIPGINVPGPPSVPPPTPDMIARRDDFAAGVLAILNDAVDLQQDSPVLNDPINQYGWAGAGIWYNRIAQVNGSLIGAVYDLPAVTKMPEIMEEIMKQRLANDQDVSGPERYKPYISNGQQPDPRDQQDMAIGQALYDAYKHWADNFSEMAVSGNIFLDAINAVFGTAGLFSMRENADRGVHPLAQLTAIGKGLMESAIRNLGYAAFAGLGGGLFNILQVHLVGTVGLAASSFLVSIAAIALSIGFILYYVVPFLPFIYFFFAVGSWIKSIFEAMVGVPLWALAHLRIDGNGLPGEAAAGGYFMILEIFLRPILTIFGMLGGIALFSAQAAILNEIWQLVTSNVTGFDPVTAGAGEETGALMYARGAVDKLFFTALYAIIVYMLGVSSFKMVDLIPNFALRWMGQNVSSFAEKTAENPESIVSRTFMGTDAIGDSLRGGLKDGIRTLGGATTSLGDRLARRNA